jgi:hypothetical protein
MSGVVIGAVVLAILVAIAFAFLIRKVVSRQAEPDSDLDWCRGFSVAKYRPMERLFVEEDYEFLAAQPGFHPRIYTKLQAERRRVFRHYLRCLSRDFDRLYAAAKMLLLDAPQDRPEFARLLLKQRFVFAYAMASVEAHLVLQGWGIGKVDVRPLVTALESMRDQLRQLALESQPQVA